jgi:ABC-type transport system involved in cytochrome bd biosynthesis fused ATPase/permease subunit
MTQPPKALHRLFYRSRQTPAVAADLDFEVQRIIGAAISRNRGVGLTGLLLTIQGHFIQALEGDINAVRATYARISLDPRHHDLRIISQGPAMQRLFGEWNMCARALAPSDQAILDVLDSKGGFNAEALTADSVQRLLTAVAAIQKRTGLETLTR